MLSIIAEVLRQKLATELPWAERVAGLTVAATRDRISTGANLQTTVQGQQTYPVANVVNVEDCWESGVYKLLTPDATKAAILFFADNGGTQLVEIEGAKGKHLRYSFNLKLLAWFNLKRIGEDMTGDYTNISGRIVPYVIAQLYGRHSIEGAFNGGPEEAAFAGIEVKRVDELQKEPAMFLPYDFSKEQHLFFWPYDYFGLSVRGEFIVRKDCLDALGAEWEPTVGCLSPAWDRNWFNQAAIDYLMTLPFFNSNEEALEGTDHDGNIVDALSLGELYRAGRGHVAAPYGSFLTVV